MIPFSQNHTARSEEKLKKQRQNLVEGLCSVLDSVLHSLDQLVDSALPLEGTEHCGAYELL